MATDEQVFAVATALQTQLDRDLTPVWAVTARATLVPRGAGASEGMVAGDRRHPRSGECRRVPRADAGRAALGKAFTQSPAPWSVTSHELIEVLGRPLERRRGARPTGRPTPAVGPRDRLSALDVTNAAHWSLLRPDGAVRNPAAEGTYPHLRRTLLRHPRWAFRRSRPDVMAGPPLR